MKGVEGEEMDESCKMSSGRGYLIGSLFWR